MSWGNCSPLLTGLLAQGDRGEVPGDSDLTQPSRGLSLCLTRCPKFSYPILFLAISKALRMPVRCSLPISRYPGHLRHAGGKSIFMGTPPSASHMPCPVLGTRQVLVQLNVLWDPLTQVEVQGAECFTPSGGGRSMSQGHFYSQSGAAVEEDA